ncbi:ABC Superfamily, partial [Phytophthora palmivora]
MPRKASKHGASAPSKSKTATLKTAKTKSKGKAAPRKEARKAASKAGSKPTAAAATQGGNSRRSRSRSLPPDDRPNPRFTYRDHSPGTESPAFDIPMNTRSEPDADTTGSAKASTSLPAKNLTLDEGKSRAQVAKAASQKRADEGAAAAKKRAEEKGTITEPQEISNDLDEQQERYQAAQLQGVPAPPTPVYPRGYYPPDAGSVPLMFLEHLKAPCGLTHGRTSRGAYERALVQGEPLFVNNIQTD